METDMNTTENLLRKTSAARRLKTLSMPKQVNGQEGDLGKPLAGQKRDLGKRLALNKGEKGKRVALEKKMRGAGEMVAGRMATRSVTRALSNKVSQDPLSSSESDQLLRPMFLEWAEKKKKNYETDDEINERFKIWCASKKYIDKCHSHEPGYVFSSDYLNEVADRKMSELCGLEEEDLYTDRRIRRDFLKFWKTKEGLKMVAEAKIEFDKWVAQRKRNYGSKKEQEKRFWAFVDNKTRIDAQKKANPRSWTHGDGYDFDNMDKFAWETDLFPPSGVDTGVYDSE